MKFHRFLASCVPALLLLQATAFAHPAGTQDPSKNDRKEKQSALHQDVCTLPFGQRIELSDIPRKDLQEDWQRRLPDSRPISLISIPATHDAGTALGKTGDTHCQVMSIPAQLAVGVRGFDVRLRLVNDQLGVYHHDESQDLAFADVMRAMQEFLIQHPKEFLIVRIRQEWEASNSTKPFEQAFAEATAASGFDKFLYHAGSRTEIPTVGQLRGKVLLLDNYGKLPDAVDYTNPTMTVQDDYDTSDMDKKESEIEANATAALADDSGKTWYISYTSSSTPQVDQIGNAQAVNAKVVQFLNHKKGHLGTIFMNFPGVRVIHEIVQSNF